VVVPAHDEGAAVARCLQALTADRTVSLDVVVVANGCTDDTAAQARAAAERLPGVRVVEIAEPSKSRALNVGDELARGFPRVYLDADVELSGADLQRLAAALSAGALAAGLRSHLVTEHSSRLVRAYARVWSQLPSVRDGLVGNGVIALSERGRARFDAFPDAMGDDFFLDRLFAPDEKAVLDGGAAVLAPSRLSDLLRRKVRVYVGNAQVLRSGVVPSTAEPGVPRAAGAGGWRGVVRREPARAGDALVYLAVTVVAKLAARRALRRGTAGWARDDSRAVPTGSVPS
jgi:glycosyltransferase involved in cell wall biosynthesis